MTVFGVFGLAMEAGRLGTLGAAGMESVAVRGLDSPFSFVRNIVTG